MTVNTEKHEIQLILNNEPRRGYAEARTLLSDFIRHELGATGTHVGCEHGVCGACTILVDGTLTRSCLALAPQVDGASVTTVEGLAGDDGTLNILQQAFSEHHALQCGFCTAGILISCTEFLQREPKPTEEQVRDMLSGHLCRCTGYTPIIRAIMSAAEQLSK